MKISPKLLKEKLQASSLNRLSKAEVQERLNISVTDDVYIKLMTQVGYRRFGNTTNFYVNFK